MRGFVFLGGLIVYYILGAMFDAVIPSLDLLGMNIQALIFSSVCMLGMVWIAVRMQLFE